MTYKELRLELHKNYYNEASLNSIAANIKSKMDIVDSFTVNAASSQIELNVNTGSPSQYSFTYAIMQSLAEFVGSTGLECDALVNMYNILISHVDGNKSTVIIML